MKCEDVTPKVRMKKMLFGIMFSMVVLSMKTVYGQTSATIEAFAVVSTNASTNVLVMVTQSNITEDVVVEMRCLLGNGEANFIPGGSMTTNICQSTDFQRLQSSSLLGKNNENKKQSGVSCIFFL